MTDEKYNRLRSLLTDPIRSKWEYRAGPGQPSYRGVTAVEATDFTPDGQIRAIVRFGDVVSFCLEMVGDDWQCSPSPHGPWRPVS
jgi:hypothetical protein